MTVLQALAGYYQRMADRNEAELPGFSRLDVSWAVVIDREGRPLSIDDLRDHTGKRPRPGKRNVPTPPKRTSAVAPSFLWDKTAYSLGVTAAEGKRTAEEHAKFRELHASLLAGTEDEGLSAFARFLTEWIPARFAEPPFVQEMLDANIVFRLDGELRFIHERPAALPLIEARSGDGAIGLCLITGTEGPIARLHPSIKGVDGAQTMGASLVSFQGDAFRSWGNEQGANAPTGEGAAARYGAALNRLLDRGSRNRAQLVDHANLDPGRRRPAEVRHRQRFSIGDATTVFWADASGLKEEVLAQAEMLAAYGMGAAFDADADADPTLEKDAGYAELIRTALQSLSAGRPAAIGPDEVPADVRISVLGLAPNAARLSVRFWITQPLGHLAAHALLHQEHCRIDPAPRGWGAGPTIQWLLQNTVAARGDRDNIPPLLAGEVARAVLGGTPYPRTLLSNALMRLRAGDDPATGWHAAVIRAVLMRLDKGGGAPVKLDTKYGLDKDQPHPGYRLGRLFAVLEEAQEQALGNVNATIRDRYFGAASATPAGVFPLLLRGVQNHLGKLRKDNAGAAAGIEIKLGEIMGGLGSELPRSLKLEEQGRFAIGYYHQRSERFRKRKPEEQPAAAAAATDTDQGD